MKLAFITILLFVSSVAAQSGRVKVNPSPSPTPINGPSGIFIHIHSPPKERPTSSPTPKTKEEPEDVIKVSSALVPIPVGPTLAAINAILLAQMDARLDTKRDAAGHTIGERFIEEQRQCRRAPTPFAPEATTFATVSPRALVRLEGAVYSVWTRWVGLDLIVRTGATAVTLVGRDGLCVTHPRKRFGERSIDYRHYLAELARKPQAVRRQVTSCPTCSFARRPRAGAA